MKTTGQAAKSVSSSKTGLGATLRGLLHFGGSGAPKSRPGKLILPVLATMLGVLAFSSAPAFAAAPETPLTEPPSEVSPARAVLHGVLNSGKPGEPGETYEFLYREGPSCAGGSKGTSGLSLDLEKEEVSEEVTGLKAGTEYTVCLLARSGKGEASGASPAHFTTPRLIETPETLAANEVAPGTWKLRGVLNPSHEGEPDTYHFNYGANGTCSGAETPETSTPGHIHEEVTAEVAGLLPDTTYTFCLRTRDEWEHFESAPRSFTTPIAAPAITDSAVFHLGSTEATVTAQINPGGELSTYQLEYEPGRLTAAQSLPPATTSVGVSVTVRGLSPETEYHIRFLATNGHGQADGSSISLTTPAPGSATGASLPDGRRYELVSPSSENAEVYTPVYNEPYGQESESGETSGVETLGLEEVRRSYQAAADGNAVTYVGDPPASGVGGSGATGSGSGNQWIAGRSASGWTATNIELSTGGSEGLPAFESFSPDLSAYTLKTQDSLPAEPAVASGCVSSPAHLINNLYSHTGDAFHALVPPSEPEGNCFGFGSGGISANDSHFLIFSPHAFVPGAVSAEFPDYNLYDSHEGHLYQVNILPSGQPQSRPNAMFGFREGEGEHEGDFIGDVSNDGSRIFWTDENTEITTEDPAGTRRLFVRLNDTEPQSPIAEGHCTASADACTVQVDAARGGSGSSGGGQYRGASADGSRVFFTDESQLTAGSSADPNEPDLYEFNVNTGALVDLTGLESGHADVLGVLGASEDGSYVYFAADGILASNATDGRSAQAGQPNVYEYHAGTITFVATVSLEDGTNIFPLTTNVEPRQGDWAVSPGNRTAQVAGSGEALVFSSRTSLTGYDNTGIQTFVNSEPGVQPTPEYAPLPEVFMYQAGAKQLLCVSCNRTGVPPQPSAEAWEDSNGGNLAESRHPTYQPRSINTAGTEVFFMSNQALVQSDTSDHQQVYEWEENGTGDCTEVGGCIAPISSVTTPHAAYFTDASADGSDVFFTQRADLTGAAIDENVKLYDARVGGGFPETSLACTGTGCQGVPPAAPSFATPASSTFSGSGNFSSSPPPALKPKALTNAQKLAVALKACKRKPKKQRAGCEKQARKRYAATPKKKQRAKKATTNRRAR